MHDCPACAAYPDRVDRDIEVAGRNFRDSLAGMRAKEQATAAAGLPPFRPLTLTAGSDAYDSSPA